MIRLSTARFWLLVVLPLLLLAGTPLARLGAQQPDPRLAQLAAPMALFPDPVLAIALSAAANPDQELAADRIYRQRAAHSCASLAGYVDRQPWDAGVKALMDFPAVADELAGNDGWRRDLGQDWRQEGPALAAELQRLRQLAVAAGTLQDSYQDTVQADAGGTLRIVPNDRDRISTPLYYPWGMYGDPPIEALFMLLPRAVLERGRIRTNAYCGVKHTLYGWGADNWDMDWARGAAAFPVHAAAAGQR